VLGQIHFKHPSINNTLRANLRGKKNDEQKKEKQEAIESVSHQSGCQALFGGGGWGGGGKVQRGTGKDRVDGWKRNEFPGKRGEGGVGLAKPLGGTRARHPQKVRAKKGTAM